MRHRSSLSIRIKLLLIVIIPVAAIVTLMTVSSGYRMSRTISEAAQESAAAEARSQAAEINTSLVSGMQIARDLAGFAHGYKAIPKSSRRDILSWCVRSTIESNKEVLAAWYIFEPDAVDGEDAKWKSAPGQTVDGRFVPYWFREGNNLSIDFATDDETGKVSEYYSVPKETKAEYLTDPYEFELSTKEKVRVISYCVPIIVEGTFVGVAGIDYDLSVVKSFTEKNKTEDSYSFVLANDAAFVAHPTAALVGKPIQEALPDLERKYGAAERIKKGEAFRYTDAAAATGKQSFVVYEPVRIGDGKRPWSFGRAVDLSRLFAPVHAAVAFLAVIGTVALIALLIALYLLVSAALRPLGYLEKALSAIGSGEADLSRRIAVHSRDELGRMADSFNDFSAHLGGIVLTAREVAEKLGSDGTELDEAMKRTETALTNVRSALSDARKTSDEENAGAKAASEAVRRIGEKIDALADSFDTQSAGVVESSASIEQMISNIASVGASVDKIAEELEKLVKSAENGRDRLSGMEAKIREISHQSISLADTNKAISTIASQTNLLAMNAAIEAAHAGEAGKGFAVVADEIRKLAESSATQSKETKKELGAIKASIDTVVVNVNDTAQSFADTLEAIDRTNALASQVRLAMDEQDVGSKQILQALGEITGATSGLKTASEEMRSAGASAMDQMRLLEASSSQVRHVLEGAETESAVISEAVSRALATARRTDEGIGLLRGELGKFKIADE